MADDAGYNTTVPPAGWGQGSVNPEAAALAREMAAKGWVIDPTRKSNYQEDFDKKYEKATVLYLHGYGDNRMVASLQAGDMRHVVESAYADVHIIEAFEQVKTHEDTYPIYPADPEYARTVLKGDMGKAYFWWKLTVPVCPKKDDPGDLWRHYDKETEEIQVAAVKKLAEHIERLGGVDGIVGFSMGGEMAYLLLQHLELLSPAHQKKLKFIGTVCSEHILSKIPLSKPFKLPHKMGFWLAYGEEDPEAVVDVPKAAEFFRDAGAHVVVRKLEKQGHTMPKSKLIFYEMNSVFLKALKRPYGGDEEHEDYKYFLDEAAAA